MLLLCWPFQGFGCLGMAFARREKIVQAKILCNLIFLIFLDNHSSRFWNSGFFYSRAGNWWVKMFQLLVNICFCYAQRKLRISNCVSFALQAIFFFMSVSNSHGIMWCCGHDDWAEVLVGTDGTRTRERLDTSGQCRITNGQCICDGIAKDAT